MESTDQTVNTNVSETPATVADTPVEPGYHEEISKAADPFEAASQINNRARDSAKQAATPAHAVPATSAKPPVPAPAQVAAAAAMLKIKDIDVPVSTVEKFVEVAQEIAKMTGKPLAEVMEGLAVGHRKPWDTMKKWTQPAVEERNLLRKEIESLQTKLQTAALRPAPVPQQPAPAAASQAQPSPYTQEELDDPAFGDERKRTLAMLQARDARIDALQQSMQGTNPLLVYEVQKSVDEMKARYGADIMQRVAPRYEKFGVKIDERGYPMVDNLKPEQALALVKHMNVFANDYTDTNKHMEEAVGEALKSCPEATPRMKANVMNDLSDMIIGRSNAHAGVPDKTEMVAYAASSLAENLADLESMNQKRAAARAQAGIPIVPSGSSPGAPVGTPQQWKPPSDPNADPFEAAQAEYRKNNPEAR